MNSLKSLVAFAITASVFQAAAMAQWCGTSTPYGPAPHGHDYPPMFSPFDIPPLPPPPQPPPSNLGVTCRMIPGVGMQVLSVDPCGGAARAGLEAGDVIMQINGQRTMCEATLRSAISTAITYNAGIMQTVVRNVRYGEDCSIQEFVTVTINLSVSIQIEQTVSRF